MTPERFQEVYLSIVSNTPKADVFDFAIKKVFESKEAMDITLACYTVIFFCQRMGKEYKLNLIDLSKDTLSSKAKEYAINNDRLWNFKNNYSFTEQSAIENLLGYLRKQAVSCMDILTERLTPTTKLVEEKFGDVLNYCILLLTIIKEKDDELCEIFSTKGTKDETTEDDTDGYCKGCKDERDCNNKEDDSIGSILMALIANSKRIHDKTQQQGN